MENRKREKSRVLAVMAAGALLLGGCGNGGGQPDTPAPSPERSVWSVDLKNTDPELARIMEGFIQDQVRADAVCLDGEQKQLIAMVSLVVQQSEDMLVRQVEEALEEGVEPVKIREAVYQCAPYVGFPRTADAVGIMNGVFLEKGIDLPLESQGTVEEGTRFEKGLDAQAGIFGDGMRQIAAGGREEMTLSSYYLVVNCFGDYYTRNGLDLETREMLTLAILVNLGTESQISAHISGNAGVGRSRDFIEEVIYQCLPYAGYPRILNALNCLNAALPQEQSTEEDGTEETSTEETGAAAAGRFGDIIFAKGEPNPVSDKFTGDTYLAYLVQPEEIFNSPAMLHVTFEPCARTDWHSHDGGQILIVTSGTGYHQVEGEPAEIIRTGDVILAEPGVKHWHGAGKDGTVSHISISTNPDNSGVNWMEPV